MNTTVEPVSFPDRLGFPTFARLFLATSLDELYRSTAQSAKQMNVVGLFRDGGYVIAFKLSQYVFDAWNYTPL